MEIVITEKTSQAKDVQAAVGSRYGQILPAEGHLLTLEEPEDVNPEWKRWSPVLLKPERRYGFKPAKGGNKGSKLQAIQSALKKASRVWIATDCDREGQLIGQEILEWAGFAGEVRRVMFTAQDPKTIRDAFAAAKPNSEYANLYHAALARAQADQIFNLSLTRTASVLLSRPGSPIGIGRVKTPTMSLVCRRELEIRNFKPVTYFEVVATASVEAGSFRMRHAPKVRLEDKAKAEAIRVQAEGFRGPLRVKVEDKRQGPPRLHDLPSLQKLCSGRFGWTAERTLDVSQALYDTHKIITYPRAETRYLAESLIPDVPRIVAGLTAPGAPLESVVVPKPPEVRKGKSGHFWDKGLEGVSHHAIIPNANTVGDIQKVLPRLSADETKMFDIIALSYLAALMPDFLYRQTTVTLDVQGHEFRATGRIPTSQGWKAVYDTDTDEKAAKKEAGEEDDPDAEQTLPPLRDGEGAALSDAKLLEKQTKPPPRYTEGTLIEAMQNAWKFVEDEALRERLKEAKGIGTPATRAEVIKGLKAQQFLEAKGKNIIPTERGLALYGLLVQAEPMLVDPGVTATWEMRLDDVLTGREKFGRAIMSICDDAQAAIDRLKAYAAQGGGAVPGALGQTSRPPTSAMKGFAERLAKEKGLSLPKGYAKDGDLVRAFLDQHAPKREGPAQEGEGPRPPSEAQLRFAEKISTEAGKPIPDDARASSKALSAWIDKHMPKQSGKGSSAPKREGKGRGKGARSPGKAAAPSAPTAPPRSPAQGAPPPAGATPLKIPFGNKDRALALGAKYASGGWFAPAGADLTPFREAGWL
ncbi:DNA topoisomerase [Sabulicella glaciei]|uniref:DNA topoisomerase n=1 Tax=Sabulicella glaciei TaxID=2984948 RepID=A0ABT3P243_9PROT|nr:DNA topoisomerase [Roseococcus sp. MDT2-1-1]MCW8088480.1 DNA topoisomerase [Roseococcus sp. MDT2-1-1]